VQQFGTAESVVDGYLYQDALRIAIETKLRADSFDLDQLQRHLSGFSHGQGGFLILLSPERARIGGAAFDEFRASAAARGVSIAHITFHEVIKAARECLNDFDEEMQALINDYEAFCSEESLLPIDGWTLFVPPCGPSHSINIDNTLYFCPAAWTRRKARYLGIYYDKAVRQIGIVAKVVQCDVVNDVVEATKEPITPAEQARIVRAAKTAKAELGWEIDTGYQFFLCDELHETNFKKTTPGGIQGHRYFNLRDYLPDFDQGQSLEGLANQLRDRKWELSD
jgi:hypothetical protein